jgi:glutamyl endopeptidase
MAWFKWPFWRKKEPKIAKSIIGPDDRLKADNPADTLWRPLCAIFINYSGKPGQSLGTGVMIAPRLVLTAAHNLYDLETGRAITGGTIKVGLINGQSSAESTIEDTIVPELYKSQSASGTEKYAFDFGLILLKDDAAHDWAQTTWPIDRMHPPSDDALGLGRLIVAGYPAELGASGTTIMVGYGPLKKDGVAARSIAYDIDTTGGQSGSPVFRYDGNTKLASIVGIHVAGFGQRGNLANRLTSETKTQIETWAAEWAKKPSPGAMS